jgi:hypothetical protein
VPSGGGSSRSTAARTGTTGTRQKCVPIRAYQDEVGPCTKIPTNVVLPGKREPLRKACKNLFQAERRKIRSKRLLICFSRYITSRSSASRLDLISCF